MAAYVATIHINIFIARFEIVNFNTVTVSFFRTNKEIQDKLFSITPHIESNQGTSYTF